MSRQATTRRAGARAAVIAACCAAAACAAKQPVTPPEDLASPSALPALAARVVELESGVRRDRARLVQLVATPRAPGTTPLREDPELREIAERLERNERELAALVAQPLPGDTPGAPSEPAASGAAP